MGPFQYQSRFDPVSQELGAVIEPEMWSPWMPLYPAEMPPLELLHQGDYEEANEPTVVILPPGFRPDHIDTWQPVPLVLELGQIAGTFVPPPGPVLPPAPSPGATEARKRPKIDRAPETLDPRLRRVVDVVRSILNPLIATGRLVQLGPDEWVVSGTPVQNTRDPNATDDISFGYVPGTIWVNTATQSVFAATGTTDGAAVWVAL